MSAFTLLWQKILRSSLWVKESKETRLVWIALLAMKDQNGEVHSSVIGLADSAKVTQEECRTALEALTSPDLDDTSGVEEGRRLKQIPGGWQIVNNDLYRFSTETKREFWRQSQKDYRLQKKLKETQNIKTETTPADGNRSEPRPRFQKPTAAELVKHGMPPTEAEKFVDYFDSVGWVVGKNKPMKDWRGAANGWMKRAGNFNGNHETPTSQLSDAEILRQAQL